MNTILTNKQSPDRHIRVFPLYKELQNVGVEPHCCQVDDIAALLVSAQQVGAQVDQAAQGSQGPRARSQQQWRRPNTAQVTDVHRTL